MITKELLDYMQAELTKGTPFGAIKTRLETQGWLSADVDEGAMKLGIKTAPAMPPPIQAAPIQSAPMMAAAPLQPITMQQNAPIQTPFQAPAQTPMQSPVQSPAQPMMQPAMSAPIQATPVTAPIAQTFQPPVVKAQPTTPPTDSFAMAQNAVEAQTLPPVTAQPVMQQAAPVTQQMNQPMAAQQPGMQQAAAPTTYEAPINAMNETMPEKKSHGKLILGIAIILILVLGGGAGAYAYFTGYFVNLNKVSAEAFASSRAAKTGTSDMTLTITAPKDSSSISLQSGSLTVKGSYDFTDTTSPKFMATLTANVESMTGTAELRLTNKILYGQLTNVSPAIGMFVPIDQFMNKWFSFDYSAAMAPNGMLSSLPIPSTGPTALEKLTDEQRAHIVAMADATNFITVGKKLPNEKINDIDSYHFTFDLNRTAITKYASDLTDYIHAIGKNDSYLSSFDLSEMTTELSYIKNFQGEAWIGTKDHLPTKFSISFDAQNDTDKTPAASVKFVSLFTDWNKPVTIEVPQNAVPIESILGPIFGEAQAKANAAKVQAQLSMMRATGALYQGDKQTYRGFCTSPDEVTAISQITATGIAASDVVCKDANSYYVITAKLPDGTFSCSDSQGYAGGATGLPKGTVCAAMPVF